MSILDTQKIKQVLSDHGYEYIDKIGEGASAKVFLVKSYKYNQLFAVKLVSKESLAQQEINSLISLIHPYIIKLYSTFNDEDHHFLVMEYCQGGTFKHKGIIPYNMFVKYARELLQVLGYCHSQKIAHRDIKPENIFIDSYNHIKLGDFGLSNKFALDESAHRKCGSLMFFSPEILTKVDYDPFKSDIYSLGITFFYFVTGKYPFHSESSKRLKEQIISGQINFEKYEINQKIKFLIMKMTCRNPNLRLTPYQLLQLPIFEANTSSKLIKSISNSCIPFLSSKKSIHNSSDTFSNVQLSDTFSSDCNNESECNVHDKNKITKIRTFYNFNINQSSHKHFIKFD